LKLNNGGEEMKKISGGASGSSVKQAYVVNVGGVVFAALLLAGCIGVQNVKSDYKLDLSSDKALVVGTLTLKRSTYSSPIFYFQNADGTYKDSIAFSENVITRRPRTDLPGRISKLFIVELPAGKYNFYQLKFPFGAMAGYIWIDMSSNSKHQVSFEVEAGKTNYVGDLFIDAESSNLKGTWVNSIGVRDMFEADKNDITKAYPGIAATDLKKLLFRTGS
jgi:hypothetical protein